MTPACCVELNRIYSIDHVEGENKLRINEMGFVSNKKISVIYKMSKYGPYILMLDGIKYAMRQDDVEKIFLT